MVEYAHSNTFKGGSMSDTWYIAIDGQQQGPMSKGQVRQKMSAGEIDGNTFAFTTGMKEWAAISSIPELTAAATPPPTPARAASGLMQAHEVDYDIRGEEMQFVEIELDPAENRHRRGRRHDVHGERDRDGDPVRRRLRAR